MGYNIPIFELLSKLKHDVHVVHWDHKKLSKYKHNDTQNIKYYKRSEIKLEDIKNIANNINPDITVVSGWMDFDYLKTAKMIKSNGKSVVCCLDNHWIGSVKQYTLKFLIKIGISKLFFFLPMDSRITSISIRKKNRNQRFEYFIRYVLC